MASTVHHAGHGLATRWSLSAQWVSRSRMGWVGAAIIVATVTTMYAAGGSLDATFGTGGKVITDFGGADEYAQAVVRTDDGKLVVAGTVNGELSLVRYNPDGRVDATFGDNGKARAVFDFGVMQPPPNFSVGISQGYALVLQPDGKLVAAGSADKYDLDSTGKILSETHDFALARFNADGTPDTDFGRDGSGTVTHHFGRGANAASAVALQGDKLVVAGSVFNGSDLFNFTLLRYNADGTLDETFGSEGIVTTDLGGTARLTSLVVQPDNSKLVAVGEGFLAPGFDGDFVLVRYDPDGSPDESFGSGGIVVTDFSGGRDKAGAVKLQTDGKLVVAGGGNDFQLARYNSNGTLDPTFGIEGKVTTDIGGNDDWANALVLQDGMFVAAGAAWNGASYDLALTRYTPEGSLDTSLGVGGRVIVDFFGGSFDQGADLVLQPDGKLVAVGHTYSDATLLDFALARYDPGPPINLPILRVEKAGDGGGRVLSSPAGIDCGGTCQAPFTEGSDVTLTADPDDGSTFAGWSDDCNASGVVTMTAAGNRCTATFTRIVHTLTVTKAGAGSGTVRSDPPGIECGPTCSFAYPEGDPVQLKAEADPGSSFGGWSGACDVQGTVTMSKDETCRATFNLRVASVTALSSSKNPSMVGDRVTITANVTGAAPSGSVTFSVDGSPVPGTFLLTGATATTSTATLQVNLPEGSHQIAATYSGDIDNQDSTGTLRPDQLVAVGQSSGTAVRAIVSGSKVSGGPTLVQERIAGNFAVDSSTDLVFDGDIGSSSANASLPAFAPGPSVGASSLGYGRPDARAAARAIAYATFVNRGTQAVSAPADAVLDGVFLGSPLTPIVAHASAAVYVFEKDSFLNAIAASGKTLAQFLVGADTLGDYAAGTQAALSLTRPGLFDPAILKVAPAFTPVVSPPTGGGVNTPLHASFTVNPNESVIIVFDLTVYAENSSTAFFSGTLKPAPNFLRDPAGNPLPLTAIGLWTPAPPVAANLTLTPTVATTSLTTPVTLTATATTAAGAPVPNTPVFFEITAGPNTHPAAPAITDASGHATLTYDGGSLTGTDQIQANIGGLSSNLATVTWTSGPLDHISVSPVAATITAGSSHSFTARAHDMFNNDRGNVTADTMFTIAPDGSCDGPTCTAGIAGMHTVTATYQGKTAMASLNVTGVTEGAFTFQGFYAPIDMSTPTLTVWNTVRPGRVVPVKWRLTQAGVPVSDPGSFAGLLSHPVDCSAATGSIEAAIEQLAAGHAGLQYDGDGNWQFNWRTASSSKGSCLAVVVKFSDGTTSPVAHFMFK